MVLWHYINDYSELRGKIQLATTILVKQQQNKQHFIKRESYKLGTYLR